MNWFRDFVPNMSQKIEKLTNKLKEGKYILWTAEDQNIKEQI